MKCQICEKEFVSKRRLSTHLQKTHNLSSKEYTRKFLQQESTCSFPNCHNETRYVSFSFKRYCSQHSSIAMKEGGKLGGKNDSWNKGRTKLTDSRILKQSIEMIGNKNHFHGKTHTEQTKNKIKTNKLLSREEIENRLLQRSDDFSFPKFSYDDYYSRQYQKIGCKCKKCHRVSKKTLQSLERGSLCKHCYPFIVSKGELELGNFIEDELGISIQRNLRNIIPPYELDVFVPSLNVAFEYNGVYWHMDKNQKGFDKNSHYRKLMLCKEKGINLYQFNSIEWGTKNELVKSMIRSRLHCSPVKLGARQCFIDEEISSHEAKSFFEENHIQGYTKSSKHIGLRTKKSKTLVCLVSFRKPFHKKYRDYIEISRFASKRNHNIIGGFSKIMMYALKNYDRIISYADLLHGNGKVYEKFGFVCEGHTGINYWYTDGKQFFNRFEFRAQNGLSEKTIAKQKKVYKFFGCGNMLYTYNARKAPLERIDN